MQGIEPIDLIALFVLVAAGVRGLINGLLREVFSIVALAAAVIAVRVWNEPLADLIYDLSRGRIAPALTPWVAGVAIAIGVVFAVGIFGSVMSRGARAVGLGFADRAGGATLGVAEGALVVAVGLTMLGAVVGREHGTIAHSRSLALLEQVEQIGAPRAEDVAAPPPEP